MTNSSFINGIIAGAGIVLALMSTGFLYYIAPLENQQGISSTEIRVAIFMGGIVAAVAIGYEVYSNKKENESESIDESPKEKSIMESEPEPKEPEPKEPEPPENDSEQSKTDES